MTTRFKLQPYQQEFLKRLDNMGYHASKRFHPVMVPGDLPGLIIEDFVWWVDNEREILNWMVDHLPRGIEHQEGMTVTFDSDHDRTVFLLRWT